MTFTTREITPVKEETNDPINTENCSLLLYVYLVLQANYSLHLESISVYAKAAQLSAEKQKEKAKELKDIEINGNSLFYWYTLTTYATCGGEPPPRELRCKDQLELQKVVLKNQQSIKERMDIENTMQVLQQQSSLSMANMSSGVKQNSQTQGSLQELYNYMVAVYKKIASMTR